MKRSTVKNGIIINDTVKLEWQASGYVETTGRNPVFVIATKVYDSANGGKVAVFFTPNTAFLWADNAGTSEEDLWSCRDMIEWIKQEGTTEAFPEQYSDNYIPIIFGSDTKCSERMLEKYGLTVFAQDIEERLEDVRPFGEEHTAEL